MSIKKTMLAVTSVLAVASSSFNPAMAIDVPFNATVPTTCTLVLTSNGTLVTNAGLTELNSEFAGGINGVVNASATGGEFSVAITPATGFATQPSGVPAGVTFDANFEGSGATTFVQTSTTTAVNAGTTVLNVNMNAVAPVGEAFPAGDYIANTVVTCS